MTTIATLLFTFLIGLVSGAAWTYAVTYYRVREYEKQLKRLSEHASNMSRSVKLCRDLTRQLDADLRGGRIAAGGEA